MSVGKVVVITGAGEGLGRAIARRFAKDGETVIALGRTLSKVQTLADELGAPHCAVHCDVTSPDSIRTAFAEIAKRHPKIDVLINNAAVYEPFFISKATDEQVLSSVLTNLSGPIFTCRSAIPMMDRGGYIINISSESVVVEFALLSLYQSTKAGLERFSQSLARELEPDGIRVSVVRAGPMYEEGKSAPTWDQEAAGQFYQLSKEAGIDMMKKPISMVGSVTNIFRSLIDLPADVRVNLVTVEGWRA